MMEDNKFCLQMKSHPKQLFGAFRELYESCSLTDVTFMCEGQSFSAHRLILSACSPYFRDLFMNLSDKHPVVFLKGVKKEEITNLLNFMYDGEVTISHTNLASFLEMADELSINGLSKTDSATGKVPNKAPSVDVEEEVTYHKPKRQRVSSETVASNECKPFPSVAVSSHVSSVSSHSTNEMTDYSNPFPSLSEDHTSGVNDSPVRNRTSAVFQQSSISTHCQSLQNDNHVDMSKKSAFSTENVNIKEEIQVLDDSMSPGKDDDLSIPFSVPSDNLYTGGNLQEGSLDSVPQQSQSMGESENGSSMYRQNGTTYQCLVCGKLCNVKQHMVYHIRTHTGERPYKCEICGLSFTQPSNMYRHKRTQHFKMCEGQD